MRSSLGCVVSHPIASSGIYTTVVPLRVAAISFLNPAPLLYDFEHDPHAAELREHYALHYTQPSACAAELTAGTSDLGLIPIAALTPELAIVPGCTIASLGKVRSILLLVKNPRRLPVSNALTQVRSVAAEGPHVAAGPFDAGGDQPRLKITLRVGEGEQGRVELLRKLVFHGLAEQRFFVGKLQIQALARHAGRSRHLIHGRLSISVARKHADRRVQNSLASALRRVGV